MRHRSYCYTWNNYPENINWEEFNFSYNIYGIEKGEHGTEHLQGYMEFQNPKDFRTLHKLQPKIHWEPRRGSQKQAIDYCKKGNNYVESGTKKAQGARNDLTRLRDIVRDRGMRAIFEDEVPNLQQIRTMEKYLEYCEEERDDKPEVIWIYGPTGSGKSTLARKLCDKKIKPYRKDKTKWWSGYDMHTEVIIEDFRPKQMEFTYLLGLIDRYGFRVETKGGFRQFRAKKIIFTSILDPKSMWFYRTDEDLGQLMRRIDKIIDINTEVGGNTNPD